MNDFSALRKLLSICDRLLGEEGCPWDREQTLKSVRRYILEETAELIDAINLDDHENIREELGDFFYNAIFLCKLAEKEGKCRFGEALSGMAEKLVSRHPHVFEDVVVKNSAEVMKNWEKIKGSERGKENRRSLLDGVARTLPALARGEKVIRKIKKTGFSDFPEVKFPDGFTDEEELGITLLSIVKKAEEKNFDPEGALRRAVLMLEKKFLEFERKR